MSPIPPFRFDPSFRPRLLALPRLLARRGGDDEGVRGRQRGGRQEFREHRPYAPGDDPRDLDWNLFLRHDQLAVKEYTRGESPQVLILLDRSGSMGRVGSGKDRIARELAVALAHAAAMGGAPVGIGILAQGGPVVLGRYRSARKLDAMIAVVERLGQASGETWLDPVGRLGPAPPEGRVCFLISDFLTPRLQPAPLLALAKGRARACLLQVVSEDERHPALPEGAQLLVDPESGAELQVEDPAALFAAYEAELRAHEEEVARLARAHALLHRVVGDHQSFEEILLDLGREAFR